jgi:hypothetical protein
MKMVIVIVLEVSWIAMVFVVGRTLMKMIVYKVKMEITVVQFT